MSSPLISEFRTPSLCHIFSKTSDEKSIALFDSIANFSGNKSKSLVKGDMTAKQYYSRITGLMSAGLIKRYRGRYSLTLFGMVVYYSLMTMRNTIDNQPKLRTT
jgi:predicted transcriptional regulator